MATILRINIILDISNQQFEFKVYENVYDCSLCNIKRRKYDFGNYILNGIVIKKLQIGGHFAKKMINCGHYRTFVALNLFLF